MRLLRARVHEHADAGAIVVVTAPEAEHVLALGEGLAGAVHQHGKRLAHPDGVAVDRGAVGIAALPGEGAAVVGVAEALETRLIAVVDAGHAGQRHLQQRGEPEARAREGLLTVVELVGRALRVGQLVLLGRPAQDGEQAHAVVGAEHVQAVRQRLGRVVLDELLENVGQLGGGRLAGEVAQDARTKRIVHHAVELLALEVLAELAVRPLVGRVLPHLADDEGIVLLGGRGGLELADEGVGQLIGHVEAPAARAGAQPPADDAVLAVDVVPVSGVGLLDVGQVLDAPPAAVAAVLLHLVPRVVRGGRILRRAHVGVVPERVEVARVAAGVVEDAVEDDGDAVRLRIGAERAERLLVAEQRIDALVVGRVVAVVARRLEDRVEVERGDAERLEVAELLADALERAAVEVPGEHLVGLLVELVGDGLVPVLDEAALGSLARGIERLGALAPIVAAGEAIGEDLVDDAVAVPVGLHRARLVHRDLERGRIAVVERALPHRVLLAGAVAPQGAVGGGDVEAVPDDARLLGRELRGVPDGGAVPAAGLHRDETLALAVDPQTQIDSLGLVLPHIDGQLDGAAQLGSTEGYSVVAERRYMTCEQRITSYSRG